MITSGVIRSARRILALHNGREQKEGENSRATLTPLPNARRVDAIAAEIRSKCSFIRAASVSISVTLTTRAITVPLRR